PIKLRTSLDMRMYSIVNCENLHLYEPSMLDEDEVLQLLPSIEDYVLDSR
ncbi:hypothetical protein KI387_018687, partial [Taxus chinensis]